MKKRLAMIVMLTLAVGCSHFGKHAEKEEEEGAETNEVKMTLDQVPAAARETLVREAAGQPIKSVDKEDINGKTQYETDVVINGTNMEIRVAPDGHLISKKVDNEAAEKSAKPAKKAEKEDKD